MLAFPNPYPDPGNGPCPWPGQHGQMPMVKGPGGPVPSCVPVWQAVAGVSPPHRRISFLKLTALQGISQLTDSLQFLSFLTPLIPMVSPTDCSTVFLLLCELLLPSLHFRLFLLDTVFELSLQPQPPSLLTSNHLQAHLSSPDVRPSSG